LALRCLVVLLALAGCRVDFEERDTSVSGDTSVGDTSVSDTSVGDTSVGDTSVDTGSPSDAGPFCRGIPPLTAAPTIDGVIDEALVLEPLGRTAWVGPGGAPPDDFVVRYATAWRPDGLYFFIEVEDSTRFPATGGDQVYCGDGVEIYVDADGVYGASPDYDDPGTIQVVAAAPSGDGVSVSDGGRWRYSVFMGAWRTDAFVALGTPRGYTVEAFVDAEALELPAWSLSAGSMVGFGLAGNYSTADGSRTTCGTRAGQLFHSRFDGAGGMCGGQPYCDVRAFCNAILQ